MDELDEILPKIKDGKCVLFIGAGVSNLCGCSVWKELVQKMRQDDIISSEIKPDENLEKVDYETQLEFFKKAFHNKKKDYLFIQYVRRSLNYDAQQFKDIYLKFILKLKKIIPFPLIILTTNFDNLLEKTRLFDEYNVLYKLQDFNIDGNPKSIFHIHGHETELEDALIVKSQYMEMYKKKKFNNFLTKIASENSILFLGSSVEQAILNYVLFSPTNNAITHFMLVDDEFKRNEGETKIYESIYNLKTIIYGKKDNFTEAFSSWIDRKFSSTSFEKPTLNDVSMPNQKEDYTNAD